MPERAERVSSVGRALRWTGEQAAFLLVAVVLVVALLDLAISPQDWKRGTVAIGAAALLAGVVRLVLPTGRVGLLAVRSRWIDALCYLVIGALIVGVDIRLPG